ncbi:hypothetical protein KAR91_35495 [Candidatus Pacearchaeota archaeon]|nr:hypothetical protein [Candidatus Pacearchaeota archaeon]
MNPEQALQLVEKAIADRVPPEKGLMHICYYEGKFLCARINHTGEVHNILLTIGEVLLRRGLTNQQWETVLSRICSLEETGVLCLKDLKL